MASGNESVVGALRADLSFGADAFQKGIVEVVRSNEKLKKNVNSVNPIVSKMEGQFKKLESQLGRMEGKLNGSGSWIGNMKTMLAPLAAGIGVAAFAGIADSWSDMTSRIGAATKDMEGAPQVMQEMLRLANASYSDIGQTVEIFSRNVGVMADLGFSTQDTLNYTEALNHALVITATKGERAASVQNALAKAMATGKLDAEGLETVLSNGGRVAEALAKSFGTTTAGLRKLQQDGKITGKVLADALIGNLEAVRLEAGEMPTTIADGFLKIRNSTTALIGSIDQQFGASASVAGWLNSISEGIGALAQADFDKILDSMANGAKSFATALLILATGRIPALIGAIGGVNVASSLMIAQFTAGAVASRAMTIAMNLQAAAARALSAAMAFVGGPIGLLVMGATALGVSYHNLGSNTAGATEAVEALADAQAKLGAAQTAFNNLQTVESFQALKAAANEALSAAQVAVEQTNAAFQSAVAWDFWLSAEDVEAARQAFINANIELSRAQAQVDGLKAKMAELGPQFGVSVEAAKALTEEQIKANISAMEMANTYQQRLALQTIENRNGKDSLQYMYEKHQQELASLQTKLAAMDIEESVRQKVIATYLESERAANITTVWGTAVAGLKTHADNAYQALTQMGNAGPNESWMDGAISGVARLTTQIWDAYRAKAALAGLDADGQTKGDTTWLMGQNASTIMPPKRYEAGAGQTKTSSGGGSSGAGGGGGGKSEAQTKMEAEKDAIEALRLRVDTLGKTWFMTTEARAAYDEAQKIGNAATPAVISSLQAQEAALQRAQANMDTFRNSFVSNFEGVITGAHSLKDALGNILKDIASMLAKSALNSAFGSMFGGMFGGIKIPGFATGTNGAQGGWAIVGERGPELAHLNRGSRVMTNSDSMKAFGGGGVTSINLNLSPDLRADIVSESKQNSVKIAGQAIQDYRQSGLRKDIVNHRYDPNQY